MIICRLLDFGKVFPHGNVVLFFIMLRQKRLNKPTQNMFVRKVWSTDGPSAGEDHIGVHLHSSTDVMHNNHFIFVMHTKEPFHLCDAY